MFWGIASSATVVRSTIAQINIATASLSGTVFEDLDRDGVRGAGEAGLPGSVIVAKCVAGPSLCGRHTVERIDGKRRYVQLHCGRDERARQW